jgi:hypothetical protein
MRMSCRNSFRPAWAQRAAALACHGGAYRAGSAICRRWGLARQVISPMPELRSCWFQPDQAQQLLRFLSEPAVPLQLPAAMRRSCLGLPEAAA